ncbi:MAG: PilZ domain-containing protein [Proteobacteria bacterium]|nr:PilZ domain-containing protein [Pseudomonadota bacterium]
MSEQVWYLHQNGQQVGPFETQQVTQLFLTNMIAKDGYIFKVGWKDWRPIEEGYEVLGLQNPTQSQLSPEEQKQQTENRLLGAPRASIVGRVVVHNNGQLTIGQGVNISEGGVFVETSDQIFTIGETLRLSIRCDGLPKAFNAEAAVIRFNNDPKMPVGYGLKYIKIDGEAQASIRQLVEDANRRGDKGRLAK